MPAATRPTGWTRSRVVVRRDGGEDHLGVNLDRVVVADLHVISVSVLDPQLETDVDGNALLHRCGLDLQAGHLSLGQQDRLAVERDGNELLVWLVVRVVPDS